MENLNDYIKRKFGIDENTFHKVLESSPSAEGYLLGSLSEQLFKQYAEQKGFEVMRIKEKPEGGYDAKSEDARGDFYIRNKRNKKDEWLVVECKSVKSNAEKRSNLTNKTTCLHFLISHSVDRDNHMISIYNKGLNSYNRAKENWKGSHKGAKFPVFRWSASNPGPGIPDLSSLWKSNEEVMEWLDQYPDDMFSEDAYWNLNAPIRLLQTHMPSSRIDNLGIESTGPLVTEFNILCLDLFLRTGKHEFVFVNSQDLNHQAKAPNHLQQNYTIDILTKKDDFKRHKLLKPWYDDLQECIMETKPKPRKLDETQLDRR